MFVAGLEQIPFGPAALFSRDAESGLLLRARKTQDRTGRPLDREASYFLQHYALVREPSCVMIASGIHAGPGEPVFGSSQRRRCDGLIVVRPGLLRYLNYHGAGVHYQGHFERCRLRRSDDEELTLDEDTVEEDRFRQDLARALSTAAGGGRLRFEYEAVYACEFTHRQHFEYEDRQYGTVAALLRRAFPTESIVTPAYTPRWTQAGLCKAILAGRIQGFVALEGGRETKNDVASHLFSFLPQRCAIRPEEIGRQTKQHIADADPHRLPEDAVLRFCQNRCQTMTKRYFDTGNGNGPAVISTHLLAWLIEERGLKHFEIVHFAQYVFRDYFRSFLWHLLQSRHEEKQKPEGGSELTSMVLKLIANGFFG